MKPGLPFRKAILCLLILILSCTTGDVTTGGGGALVPTATPDSPVLLRITLTPDTAPSRSTTAFHVRFTFSDSDGNLEGGTLTYIRQGAISLPIRIPALPDAASGESPTLFFTETLSPTVGRVLFQFFLTDTAGNRSNFVSVYLNQT